MMTIPEAILKKIIDHFFDYTVDNYLNTDNKEESFLWFLFGDKKLGKYDYFKNAAAIFSRDDDHPRKIETHLFFNRERFGFPTIHIGLPSEQLANGGNGIGFDYTTTNIFKDPFKFTAVRQRLFHSRFNIVCTSDNSFETLIVYNWMKCCLIGNVDILEVNGLQNPILSGGDVLLDEQIMASNVFSRALFLDVMYDTTSPSFQSYMGAGELFMKGIDP